MPKKGQKLDTCASKYQDYICCNVKVLKSVSNCPYDCTYCFLQNYLTDGLNSLEYKNIDIQKKDGWTLIKANL